MKLPAIAVLFCAALGAHGEATRKHSSLTLDGARAIIHRGVNQANELKTTGAFAVVDAGGNLLALERLDGTFAASSNIATGKARTAALFQKATRAFEDTVNKGRTSMVALSGGALDQFTPLAGGVPIVIDGEVVGAVGVSGAASANQDEELALLASKALETAPQVSYFPAPKVTEAFSMGSVLFDHGERYMVHASRREKPGMAEIHTQDADIVHVLEGTATLVTGGEAVNVKVTAPGELRGDSISGGEARELSKGDVVIIPAGVPHWFKDVSNPFLYYVVKAR